MLKFTVSRFQGNFNVSSEFEFHTVSDKPIYHRMRPLKRTCINPQLLMTTIMKYEI